jgi:hypothetical protein
MIADKTRKLAVQVLAVDLSAAEGFLLGPCSSAASVVKVLFLPSDSADFGNSGILAISSG